MKLDLSALKLEIYPAKVLRKKAAKVEKVDASIRALIEFMFKVMYEEEGIGLAAPQIGVSLRIFVVDVPNTEKNTTETDPPSASGGPMVYVNPVITCLPGKVVPYEEGCLSLPDIRGDVLRPPVISVTALDDHSKEFTQVAGGLLSRCIQHETDHLDGVLIIDKMVQMSRIKNKTAIKDLERG